MALSGVALTSASHLSQQLEHQLPSVPPVRLVSYWVCSDPQPHLKGDWGLPPPLLPFLV